MSTYSKQYNKLSLNEKVGQLFFIGVPGEELDSFTSDLIDEISPGGVCLFARNTKNSEKTRDLLENIRENLPFEPFLSLDQEGGLVDRLRRICEPFPSPRDISKSRDFENVVRLAKITAEAVRILGFNMNFAPVTDVADESREDYVMNAQQRVFGDSKEETFEYTSKYLQALQEGGCLGCIKHFPGIGAVEFDPHSELPSVLCSGEELFETDLFPYVEHFRNGDARAVMIGHTAFPSIDLQETDSSGKLLPSSLSYNFVTSLLRIKLGFDDLALTDDLEMGAILKNYGIGEASKMAFQAGNDFLLICNDPAAIRAGFHAVLEAAEQGEISEDRINESLERIWRIRQDLQAPLEFNESRLEELSREIVELKNSL